MQQKKLRRPHSFLTCAKQVLLFDRSVRQTSPLLTDMSSGLILWDCFLLLQNIPANLCKGVRRLFVFHIYIQTTNIHRK